LELYLIYLRKCKIEGKHSPDRLQNMKNKNIVDSYVKDAANDDITTLSQFIFFVEMMESGK
jgi:hypothetical protein